MTPRIDDPELRTALVEDLRDRAKGWYDMEHDALQRGDDVEARMSHLRAAVLEQYATDLEERGQRAA